MKLAKSLAELDAAADELLAKSVNSQEDLTPEEISDEDSETKDESLTKVKGKSSQKTQKEDLDEDTEESDDVKKSCNFSSGKKNSLSKSDNEEDEDSDEELNKSDDTEDEDNETPEDESDEDENTEDEDNETPEDIEKSVREDFQSDDTVRAGMENSEFLTAVVDIFSKSLGDMQYDIQSQRKSHDSASQILVKSLQSVIQANESLHLENERLTRRLNKLEKSINKGFDRIMDSLDEMSTQPAHMRKSLSNISVHDRDFGRSLNGQQVTGGFESMSKSQVLEILNTELYSGNQNVTAQDIISYESGAPLRPNLQSLVASKNRN